MSEQIFNTRIIHKHDTEANWNKAVNFIPKQGELIVYDSDENCNYQRIKIGDGVTNVNSLPFVNIQVDWDQADNTKLDYIKNKPDENDALELLMEMNLIEPVADEDGSIYTDENGAMYTII